MTDTDTRDQKSDSFAGLAESEASLFIEKNEEVATLASHPGHRARLRHRLLQNGPESLADYELLEILLFQALPRRDTKPLAKKLLQHFGSTANVISASPDELKKIKGVGDSVIAGFKTVRAAALLLLKAEIENRPVFNNWDHLADYLVALMSREKNEALHVLFLDNKGHLISDETLLHGTVNHTPAYPREIIKRALDIGATGIILVHNHPSGDPTPSPDDITHTKNLKTVGKELSIHIYDHVIIGNGRYISMAKKRLI